MDSPQLSQDVNTSVVEETPLSNQIVDPSEVVRRNPAGVIQRLFPCDPNESRACEMVNKHEVDEIVTIQSKEIDKLRGELISVENEKFSLQERASRWEMLHSSWVKDVSDLQDQVRSLQLQNQNHVNEEKKWVQQVVALEKKVDAIDAEKSTLKDEIAALKLDINQFMAELGASDLELEKVQLENAELVATLIQSKKDSSEQFLKLSRENADLCKKIQAQESEIVQFQRGFWYRTDAVRQISSGSFLNNSHVSGVQAFQCEFDNNFHQALFGEVDAGRNLVVIQKTGSEDGVILQGIGAQVQRNTNVDVKLNGETASFCFHQN